MKIRPRHIAILSGWILLAAAIYFLFWGGELNLDLIHSSQRSHTNSSKVAQTQPSKTTSSDDTNRSILKSSNHLTLDGQRFDIQAYRVGQKNILTIISNGNPITDTESTHRILLTYVWQQKGTIIPPDDVASLTTLYLQLKESREQYQGLFEVARSLEPIIEKIDELRSRRLPFDPVEVKGVVILDNNVWDVICTIPVNAADLCLLEPLVRGLNEQGSEIESLLTYAEEDLGSLLPLLEKRDINSAIDGVRLNAAAWRSYFTLLNLVIKLQEYSSNLGLIKAFNLDAMQAIQNEAWGDTVGKIIKILQFVPGFDLHLITDNFVALQKNLDDKLDYAIVTTDDLSDKILDRVIILEKALNETSSDISDMNNILDEIPDVSH